MRAGAVSLLGIRLAGVAQILLLGISVPQFVTKTPPGTVFHSGALHFRGQRPIPTILRVDHYDA